MHVMERPPMPRIDAEDDVLSAVGPVDRATACADDVKLWDDDDVLTRAAGAVALRQPSKGSRAAA
jgi:hypothetical protein